MTEPIIVVTGRPGPARWSLHLAGPGRERFRSGLAAEGLGGEEAGVLEAMVVRRTIRTLDVRPVFNGTGWDPDALELHVTAAQAPRLVGRAIRAYLNVRLDHWASVAFAREWRFLQLRMRRTFPGFRGRPERRFPRFDAPLRRIPKQRPGEFRIIAVPTREQKEAARWLLPVLDHWVDPTLPLHGFLRGRNAVTNAKVHVGFRWSLCFDLENFFDHVTTAKLVAAGLPVSLARAITDTEGIARQGYPTSPAAANLAFQEVDRTLLRELPALQAVIAYSRYADDLTFSSDSRETLEQVQVIVERAVREAGFRISHRKTHWWDATAGRRVITGVAVGPQDVRAPREIRRRLRAARHQGRIPEAAGLAEWNRLKEPNAVR